MSKSEKLACHVCQVIGGSVCDIDSKDCGVLPEIAEILKKGIKELATDCIKVMASNNKKEIK